jgi:predicted GNAT family acetyltransferase
VKGNVYLLGDASGQNRTAQTTDSMWKTVKEVFISHFGGRIRYLVPASNPSVKDTIQCVNWALRSNLVRFAEKERNVYMSMQSARADKYGEIDKANDYKPTGIKSHETDTARYALWHFYSKHYPGNRGGVWAV